MSTFNGTPFNDEQLDHMRSIDRLPDEEVSWCGWGSMRAAREGDCCCDPACPGKTEGKTRADKIKVWCPNCRNYPRNGVLTHSKFCTAPPPSSTDEGTKR